MHIGFYNWYIYIYIYIYLIYIEIINKSHDTGDNNIKNLNYIWKIRYHKL